jgi:hypothetical protein
MANGRGGKRLGAGRKKRETVVGVPKYKVNRDAAGSDTRNTTVSGTRNTAGNDIYNIAENEAINLVGEDMPQPNEYLSRPTHGLTAEKRGVQIYERAWNWLKVRDCEKLINPENLQLWALQVAKYEQLTEALDRYGHLSKHPTTGMPCRSPFEESADRFLKKAMSLWAGIEVLIAERVKFYADKTGAGKSPLDILLNRSAVRALNSGSGEED